MTVANKISLGTRPATWHIPLPFQGEDSVLGSYVLPGPDNLVLVDPGPESTLDALLSTLQEMGLSNRPVTHILLTHIHLDHAGSVGTLLKKFPAATVYVHSKGAPHLIDPSRFIASATRIYGERMNELWGQIEAIPGERIHVLNEHEVLTIGDRRLEAHYTPGHAIHHVIYFDVHTGELFAGDLAGVRLQGVDYVRPPTPPPDFDLDAWSKSIHLVKQLRPDVLYLAHFGPSDNPQQHLEQLRERLITWSDLILSYMRQDKSEEEITRRIIDTTTPDIRRISRDERMVHRYDLMAGYQMSVQGIMRYWRKKYPDQFN